MCSETPLPSLGMWACLANPNCSGADPNLPPSWKNIAILSQIPEGNEATNSPDQPSTLAAVPVCFFASFSSSGPETAHARGQGCAAKFHGGRTTRDLGVSTPRASGMPGSQGPQQCPGSHPHHIRRRCCGLEDLACHRAIGRRVRGSPSNGSSISAFFHPAFSCAPSVSDLGNDHTSGEDHRGREPHQP